MGNLIRLLWSWLKRIIEIGILDFLRGLGWKVWAGLLAFVAICVTVIVLLIVLLLAVL